MQPDATGSGHMPLLAGYTWDASRLGRPAGWSRDRLRRGATPGARSAGSRVWVPPATATRHGSRVTPRISGTSGPGRDRVYRTTIDKRAGPGLPGRGQETAGPEEGIMTAETAPGLAGVVPGGPAEPGPARPSLPDRMARYGIWVAVITHIVLHDRRFHATGHYRRHRGVRAGQRGQEQPGAPGAARGRLV